MSENLDLNDYLTLNDYQDFTNTTAIYPGQGGLLGLNYAALEAAGEAGEIANKVKKISRDSYREMLNASGKGDRDMDELALGALIGGWEHEYLSEEQRDAIAKEVGGALYGLARVCSELGVTLGDVAQQNLNILSSRRDRGVLEGSGDDR